MRRRKPDTIEVQQMKAQAKEDKHAKQMERAQLARMKESREDALKEKIELEQRLRLFEEEKKKAEEGMCVTLLSMERRVLLSFCSVSEIKHDLESSAALEEKLRKKDQEAAALQRTIEEEKARMAEVAASQKKQTEEEVIPYTWSWSFNACN